MLHDLTLRSAAVLTSHLPDVNGFPDPGHGVAPPGADKILELMRWGLWLATGGCIVGAVAVGVQLALGAIRGDQHRHGGALIWVLLGAVVVGSSTAIVSALM